MQALHALCTCAGLWGLMSAELIDQYHPNCHLLALVSVCDSVWHKLDVGICPWEAFVCRFPHR